MPLSAEGPREAAISILLAIERSCLDAEAAFVERRWPEVDAAYARQSEMTGDLAAIFAAEPEVAPERDEKIAQRVRGILSYRDDQLHRLKAYHAEVSRRLQSIGRVRKLSRSIGTGAKARLLDGQY